MWRNQPPCLEPILIENLWETDKSHLLLLDNNSNLIENTFYFVHSLVLLLDGWCDCTGFICQIYAKSCLSELRFYLNRLPETIFLSQIDRNVT